MMDEAASTAEKIRASQGYHEVEVSCTGEAGLHESFVMCDKNPGHANFIPATSFNIKHLPACYRDNDLMELVSITSGLTCRLSVPGVSKNRPDTWPGSDEPFPFSSHKGYSFTMTGTGWVSEVHRYSERHNKTCVCEECHRPGHHTPKKMWGEIVVTTACHVVYDDEEAKHTKCQFFYDSHETDINNVLTLTGLEVVHSYIKGDTCEMIYVTHDMDVVNKFYEMHRCWWDIRYKVYNEYRSNKSTGGGEGGAADDTNDKDDLCVIVSHPHGCSKQITVGAWTQRQVVDKDGRWGENTLYWYNTPTCPGSSGAPVITLIGDSRWPSWLYYHPSHSQGRLGNDNRSGAGLEMAY